MPEDVFSLDVESVDGISLIDRPHDPMYVLVVLINQLQHERCRISVLDRRSVGKQRSKISVTSAHAGIGLFCLHIGIVNKTCYL